VNAEQIEKLKSKRGQCVLDIGAGEHIHEGAIGMDKRKLPHIDVVHDIEVTPWPFPAETFNTIIASHIIEHLKPWTTLDVMNEAWRVLKPTGRIMIAAPYGTNFYYVQDPTHINPINEAWPSYFDPEDPSGLWSIYKTSPWKIELNTWHSDGTIEIVLAKRPMKNGANSNGNGKRNGKK
jgi:SAM-dependent methyltransferase